MEGNGGGDSEVAVALALDRRGRTLTPTAPQGMVESLGSPISSHLRDPKCQICPRVFCLRALLCLPVRVMQRKSFHSPARPSPRMPWGGGALLSARMDEAGCKASVGRPRNGWIGIQTANGILRFDCNGITGPRIRGAVNQYRAILQQRFADQGAFALGGYIMRHYLGSIRYCDQIVTSTYMGTELIGQEVTWDNSSCKWVDYYWDEWQPGVFDEEIPAPHAGGGGPYYSPTDPEHRTPTIDTMPSPDHLCEHLDSLKRHQNRTCVVPLNPLDSIRIQDSLLVYLRPLYTIADSLARRECDSLSTWMYGVKAYSRDTFPLVWRGTSDSVLPTKQPHDAESADTGSAAGPQTFHVDRKILDKANTAAGKKDLLRAVMHESAHVWGTRVHSDSPQEVASGYANTPYFRSLHASSACIF